MRKWRDCTLLPTVLRSMSSLSSSRLYKGQGCRPSKGAHYRYSMSSIETSFLRLGTPLALWTLRQVKTLRIEKNSAKCVSINETLADVSGHKEALDFKRNHGCGNSFQLRVYVVRVLLRVRCSL